jgi:phosphatidylcholine synthase
LNIKKVLAMGVHCYTSLGIVPAFAASLYLFSGNGRGFLLSLWVAVFIDATDGVLARRLQVKEVLPGFDGGRLDDIIDYVTYVFLPCLALVRFDFLPQAYAWWAVVPMLASTYGFSQGDAKTEESFVGFPSYWNVFFLYAYVFSPPPAVLVGFLCVLSVLIFIPLHYIYPSRTAWLRKTNVTLAFFYGVSTGILCIVSEAPWAEGFALATLVYPLYYATVSLLFQHRFRRQQRVS